jgi:hypothetical protein
MGLLTVCSGQKVCLRGRVLVGGLFYFSYPGGTGLTNGAVFGRIAGASAGRRARSRNA